MSKSKALILGITDTGEKIPAASGRISTQEGSATEIFAKSQDSEKNQKLIYRVTQSGHTSTIEHTVFNIAFENVSVFAEQFIIEFRLASFTVKSRRYVDFSNSGYYIPEELTGQNREKFIELADSLFADYAKLCENGAAKEDARFVLPYCLYSNFFCTLNARELINMLRSMLYGRGSRFSELKNLGNQLAEQAKKLVPGIMTAFEERAEKQIYPEFPQFSAEEKESDGQFSAKLISYEPSAAETVAVSALLEQGYSYSAAVKTAQEKANREKIIKYLISSPRPRALENTAYTFAVKGISLSCLTHYARHRMQSIQIPCLTKTDRVNYVLPPDIKINKENLEIYQNAFAKALRLYRELKANGTDENILVYTLLSGNLIDIVTTMNARELLLFFKLRTCTRAQWEIREHTLQMLSECRKTDPEIFSHYGPSCYVTGACPEGRMCCGRMNEMKEKFSGTI